SRMRARTSRAVVMAPRRTARVAGAFYLLNIVTGSLSLALAGRPDRVRETVDLLATACYAVVVLLLFRVFQPAGRRLSMLALVLGLGGCAASALREFGVAPAGISSLAFFGGYCLALGALILRSSFFPRPLGALLVFGGLSWLTFAFPALAKQ